MKNLFSKITGSIGFNALKLSVEIDDGDRQFSGYIQFPIGEGCEGVRFQFGGMTRALLTNPDAINFRIEPVKVEF